MIPDYPGPGANDPGTNVPSEGHVWLLFVFYYLDRSDRIGYIVPEDSVFWVPNHLHFLTVYLWRRIQGGPETLNLIAVYT